MKIENVKIYGLEESIKTSGYPMITETDNDINNLSDKDYSRAFNLAGTKIGEGHDNFLNGIIVQFDLTFSLKAWTEMQRYHFIDFVSSQSTMHRITRFNIEEQCNLHVDRRIIDVLNEKIKIYNDTVASGDNETAKEKYLDVLYNIPTGFQLTARMTTNYRQLKTINKQRENHRLPEWREFCKWIKTLPYADKLILVDNK